MEKKPWYQWTHRWNQVNTAETDPRDCDLNVWKEYWRKNHIQGTIVNAAGTVGYYPSANPYQYRAKFLGDRDYVADFCQAAKEEGLAVIARIDSNQALAELYQVHPDWFCKDKEGKPVSQTPGRYYTCINGGYYEGQMRGVVKEIIERYEPDAVADNTATGPRGFICYCDCCRRQFREYSGLELPEFEDYESRTFRIWMEWNQRCRVERYEWFHKLTTGLGGEDCIYLGMFKISYEKGLLERVMDEVEYSRFNKAVMIDGQIRMNAWGFDSNSTQGLAMHEIFGDDTLILESVAAYALAPRMLRKSANTQAETESWMRSALAGGISPSTHFIGGVQEDRRAFENGEKIFRWHRDNEEYLYNRKAVANVGLVRSFRNTCFFGQEDNEQKTEVHYRGMMAALKRGRIPFFPIDARQIKEKSSKGKLLILPNIAVLTDEELNSIDAFVLKGGSLVVTGATGMLDEWGFKRTSFPLDKRMGIEREEKEPLAFLYQPDGLKDLSNFRHHNYIRITEPGHPVWKGFERTSILGLHGDCYQVTSERLKGIAHMIPPFPIYPPEISYMDDGKRTSGYPAILAGETGLGGRVVYFAADYDRAYGETLFPDYGDLLCNAVKWALGEENLPFSIEGKGELDGKLFIQEKDRRYVMQILNHSGLSKWPGSVEEFYPVGPEKIRIAVGDRKIKRVCARNAGQELEFREENGWAEFVLNEITDQELLVIEWYNKEEGK